MRSKLLSVIEESWTLPYFKKSALLQCHMFWISPIKGFYVSYDYLKQNGYTKSLLAPYANILPVLYRMLKHDDEYMRSMTGIPKERYDTKILPELIPLIKTEGKMYLKEFRDYEYIESIRDTVTAPVLGEVDGWKKENADLLWSRVDHIAKCVPNSVHPFLMSNQEYIDHLTQISGSLTGFLKACRDLGSSIIESGIEPTYNKVSKER